MDSLNSATSFASESEQLSGYPLPPTSSTRRTSHYRNSGGLGYGVGVAWTHLRPFLPFFLISSLVVALVYLLQVIVYGGPFTDPLFFTKFDQRWPPPGRHPPITPATSGPSGSQ